MSGEYRGNEAANPDVTTPGEQGSRVPHRMRESPRRQAHRHDCHRHEQEEAAGHDKDCALRQERPPAHLHDQDRPVHREHQHRQLFRVGAEDNQHDEPGQPPRLPHVAELEQRVDRPQHQRGHRHFGEQILSGAQHHEIRDEQERGPHGRFPAEEAARDRIQAPHGAEEPDERRNPDRKDGHAEYPVERHQRQVGNRRMVAERECRIPRVVHAPRSA